MVRQTGHGAILGVTLFIIVGCAGEPEEPRATTTTAVETADPEPGPSPALAPPQPRRVDYGVWDLRRELPAPHGTTWAVAFSPDGRTLAVAGGDARQTAPNNLAESGEVQFWSAREWKRSGVLRMAGYEVRDVAYSPDGKAVATAGTGNYAGGVTFWDVASLREILTLEDSSGDHIRFSPDGRYVVVEYSLWEAATGHHVRDFPTGGSDRCFSPDGSRIACGDKIMDVETGETLVTFKNRGESIEGHVVSFSPDGKWLATGPPDILRDGKTGRPIETEDQFLKAGTRVFSLAWHPDGRVLATGGEGDVIVWDVARGAPWRTLEAHKGAVWALAFSPDGRLLVSGGFDGVVKVWELDPGGR